MSEPDPALLQFVEHFAQILTETGFPRMAARVFAYVLAEDREMYTARDVAVGLDISPAAVSGAVRTLVQLGLLGKERRPGDRNDYYRVYDEDVWTAILRQREPAARRWYEGLAEGARGLGRDRPGGRRVRESELFFAFMLEDLPGIVERWQAYRAEALGTEDAGL